MRMTWEPVLTTPSQSKLAAQEGEEEEEEGGGGGRRRKEEEEGGRGEEGGGKRRGEEEGGEEGEDEDEARSSHRVHLPGVSVTVATLPCTSAAVMVRDRTLVVVGSSRGNEPT